MKGIGFREGVWIVRSPWELEDYDPKTQKFGTRREQTQKHFYIFRVSIRIMCNSDPSIVKRFVQFSLSPQKRNKRQSMLSRLQAKALLLWIIALYRKSEDSSHRSTALFNVSGRSSRATFKLTPELKENAPYVSCNFVCDCGGFNGQHKPVLISGEDTF